MERWKDIRGYEGIYQISNMGRVKSVERKVWYKAGYERSIPERILRLTPHSKSERDWYYVVTLSKSGRAKQYFVHRLVAEHFSMAIPGKDFVNHIDGDKHNNVASNLEWVTSQENKIHAVYSGLDTPNFGIIPVFCKTNMTIYPSVSAAARELNLCDSSISKVCRGKWHHTKGMVFEYAG